MPPSAVVVGAGVLGSALADRLARSSWDVQHVEQYAPGHVRSGSGDESRLIRAAHGADAMHARMSRRALELWRELDPRLVCPSGVAWFARRPDGWEADAERVLTSLGIPNERVDPTELFPSVRTDDLAFTLLEPEAGLLRARDGVRALADRAVQAGAERIVAVARPDGERVVLDDGRVLEADHVIWACGAWMARLFGDVLDLRITHQDVYYFGVPGRWAAPGVPGWVDFDGAVYGMGDLDGRGVKVGPDQEGPAIGSLDAERRADPTLERTARAYLGHRFPGIADAPLVGSRVCQYEMTPDEHFVVAPHPAFSDGRVWLVGGGSGHAFKHGPALAERLERWILASEAPEPAFGLGPERHHDVQLRTGGSPLSGSGEPSG
ncbi:MAG TPA: FAD-dependent oxidoreductase [Baekduia sp.]|uniref:FAD-dependent oxidoreductase n=1 Tax=Baekduia sp. TaxID=2600305 RepID=UPI002D79B084|nr:FAD-dependent oxidoreductase [Baekduia sp.]HET6510382.1 FAD-dependent oxidoreductase [Baekduia sp.]